MAQINWNPEKAIFLQQDTTRNKVSFEDCVIAIEDGRVLDDLPHPKKANQRLLILEINNYAYVAPYVFDEEGIFLKTVFPSRKHTAQYLAG